MNEATCTDDECDPAEWWLLELQELTFFPLVHHTSQNRILNNLLFPTSEVVSDQGSCISFLGLFKWHIPNFKEKFEFPLFVIKLIKMYFKVAIYILILKAEKINFVSFASNTSFTFNDIYISPSTCHDVAQILVLAFLLQLRASLCGNIEITFESVG